MCTASLVGKCKSIPSSRCGGSKDTTLGRIGVADGLFYSYTSLLEQFATTAHCNYPHMLAQSRDAQILIVAIT